MGHYFPDTQYLVTLESKRKIGGHVEKAGMRIRIQIRSEPLIFGVGSGSGIFFQLEKMAVGKKMKNEKGGKKKGGILHKKRRKRP